MIDTMEDPAIRFRLKQREMMRRRAHKQGVLIGCAFGWMSVVGAGPPAPCAPLPQGLRLATIAMRQTRLASSDALMEHGIFAVRSDGAELRTISPPGRSEKRSNALPVGPLHWVPPAR
jgi:hypothetical protein